MTFGFLSGFIAQIVCMIMANIKVTRKSLPTAFSPSFQRLLRSSIAAILWSPTVRMCVITNHTSLYIAVWASPVRRSTSISFPRLQRHITRPLLNHFSQNFFFLQMLFELLVLIFTVINALDRPRTAKTRIMSTLYSDGVAYFIVRVLWSFSSVSLGLGS